MTISITDYYAKKQPVRKKEPQYIAFINKNSCTSCNSCASMCPVDCIYEMPGDPAQSYHVIDTSRCIGCQMCYRVPSESTGPWTMEICPWNAIDLIFNPNFKEADQWEYRLEPYYVGEAETEMSKLEELGYQLFLNREIYATKGSVIAEQIQPFLREDWAFADSDKFAVLQHQSEHDNYDRYVCTSDGSELVAMLYHDYDHMFLD